MISILIPVYNYDVTSLVTELHKQCIQLKKPFEILVFDDCSFEEKKTINRGITALQGVVYKELEQNVGRSKIRNLLADSARYELLLFIDSDALVCRNNFIAQYLQYASQGSVVCGGLLYMKENEVAKNKHFRWHYGVSREEKNACARNLKPYDSFSTFNFLTTKQIQACICFDERMRRYGHEDTMYGIDLQLLKIPIIHIDNPLIHAGIEDTSIFLNKTKNSLRNLKHLISADDRSTVIMKNINLLRYYGLLKKYRLTGLMRVLFIIFEKPMIRYLGRTKPRLFIFDIYKLGYLCAIKDRG